MKNEILQLSVVFLGLLLLTGSCQKSDVLVNTTVTSQIIDLPLEPLNADESGSLLLMREEEKLAKDVYTALYAKWGIIVFLNISPSEQQHTDAILTLLNKYGLKDPVGNNVAGVFTSPYLQTLYTNLVAQGSTSVLDAYKVGATIEDLDIFDLAKALLKNDNQDIKLVYDLLLMGSRNHMRSFYGQIISLVGSYSAQFITQSELEAIVTTPREKGSSW
jgi:hypothetical protein